MIPIKKLSYAFVLVLACAACSNESDPVANKANFTRIYDNNNFNTAYTPLDLKQTPDGGFLILGSRRLDKSNFTGIYILKVNEFYTVTQLEGFSRTDFLIMGVKGFSASILEEAIAQIKLR